MLSGSWGLVDDKESLSLLVDFHFGLRYTPYNMRKFAFVCITFDLLKFNLDSKEHTRQLNTAIS